MIISGDTIIKFYGALFPIGDNLSSDSGFVARKVLLKIDKSHTSSYISESNYLNDSSTDFKSLATETKEILKYDVDGFTLVNSNTQPFETTGNYIKTLFSASYPMYNKSIDYGTYSITYHEVRIAAYLFDNDILFYSYFKQTIYYESNSNMSTMYHGKWYRIPVIFHVPVVEPTPDPEPIDPTPEPDPDPIEEDNRIETDCCILICCYPHLYKQIGT